MQANTCIFVITGTLASQGWWKHGSLPTRNGLLYADWWFWSSTLFRLGLGGNGEKIKVGAFVYINQRWCTNIRARLCRSTAFKVVKTFLFTAKIPSDISFIYTYIHLIAKNITAVCKVILIFKSFLPEFQHKLCPVCQLPYKT